MNYPINIFNFCFCIFIVVQLASFSQTDKDITPVFVLQGTVKLKGKPMEGVSLSLKKDGQSIAKIITPKNGLYYFQMNKSNTDPNHEYLLNIVKAGVAVGTLRINTYTTKEDYVPYIFNLDFNLDPSTAVGTVDRRDCGRIKWNTERNIFDFDKDYFAILEKEKQKKDSLKNVLQQAKIKKDVRLEKELDSLIAYEITVKEDEKNSLNKKTLEVSKETNRVNKGGGAKKQNIKSENNVERLKTNSQTDNTGKLVNGGNNQLQINRNPKSGKEETLPTKETGSKKQVIRNDLAELKSKANVENASEKIAEPDKFKVDSISSIKEKQKDLFFLTGVPMGQFRKNLSAATPDASVFDASAIVFSNNERNRVLSEKERMARKKAENLAKKHETNNTLTSLLNEVEEYEKK